MEITESCLETGPAEPEKVEEGVILGAGHWGGGVQGSIHHIPLGMCAEGRAQAGPWDRRNGEERGNDSEIRRAELELRDSRSADGRWGARRRPWGSRSVGAASLARLGLRASAWVTTRLASCLEE